MDIEGLGEKQIQNFYEKGLLKNTIDIYDLHKRQNELEEMDGLGKKSVKIILEHIKLWNYVKCNLIMFWKSSTW